jgi:hypothetical protein
MFFCFDRDSEPITYKTTSPRREMHVVSVYVWRDGASTGRAREKNLVSDGYATVPVERTPPAQARPVVT